ncbi:flagellar biosynthesis anti-sigma factor FlgM [Ammoniphilus sp. CFH 90114]|uniref:flagellar biosynthesis anti-sigma factor FlgM n=1 Tax=Ammoniphilus sp. CFH 90114 TaxID=2493665 RepID=UPI00100DCAD4|nr:flagellar biosynthesis anti-sigma factor FlgM [Ammoniphilus sp. CFH 90114]RXT04479.1 flagellar biosynthesis anti-sigma factor FlgM [Ammoniphilus sp. CFH 90114]
MKIHGNNRLNGINPYQKMNPPAMEKSKKATGGAKDEIQISTEALEMLNHSKTDDAARKARIQDLKTQVQEGTYRVDSQKLAEKLYEELKGR